VRAVCVCVCVVYEQREEVKVRISGGSAEESWFLEAFCYPPNVTKAHLVLSNLSIRSCTLSLSLSLCVCPVASATQRDLSRPRCSWRFAAADEETHRRRSIAGSIISAGSRQLESDSVQTSHVTTLMTLTSLTLPLLHANGLNVMSCALAGL
jgi:hypothetical protein